MRKKILVALVLILILALNAACIEGITPSTSPVVYSEYQLQYQLLDKYPDYFWCDPDSYPVGRPPDQVQAEANEQFPTIMANTAEFNAILEHLGLSEKSSYSDAEKLSVYQEYKTLSRGVQLEPSGNNFTFTLRTGEGNGFQIKGTISPYGIIRETGRESSINICPICLTKGTLIDTPEGQIPVEQIVIGMKIWTSDLSGRKVAAVVIATGSTEVPPAFQTLKITLADGRNVTASPGHPSSTGKDLGEYRPGDLLDGSRVVAAEKIAYDGGYTYDILPSGPTGLYWANGISLGSTLDISSN